MNNLPRCMSALVIMFFIASCATTLKDVNQWQTEGSKGFPKLIKLAEDTKADAMLRIAAIKALGNTSDTRAVQSLLGIALTDNNPGIREGAVNALIAIGKPANEAIIKIAENASSEVKLRLIAIKAL
ncbi:HEAT repeat domain-containing protein, partial [bacterium]|nr:HEAT repeat domain-containing protein [bacterium]